MTFLSATCKIMYFIYFWQKENQDIVLRGNSLCLFHFQLDMKCSAKSQEHYLLKEHEKLQEGFN